MSPSKKTLVKIGAEHPDLRPLIRSMLKKGGAYESKISKLETSCRDMAEALNNLLDLEDDFNGYEDDDDIVALPGMFQDEAINFIKAFGTLLADLEGAAYQTNLGEDEIEPALKQIREAIKKHLI